MRLHSECLATLHTHITHPLCALVLYNPCIVRALLSLAYAGGWVEGGVCTIDRYTHTTARRSVGVGGCTENAQAAAVADIFSNTPLLHTLTPPPWSIQCKELIVAGNTLAANVVDCASSALWERAQVERSDGWVSGLNVISSSSQQHSHANQIIVGLYSTNKSSARLQ